MKTYSISIPKGTKVQSERSAIVELQGDVIVDAIREKDGGYSYSVDGTRYFTCAGVVTVLRHEEPKSDVYRHKDGLVVFA